MAVPSVIPTPPGQRWREFRIQVLPVFVFLATLAAAATVWKTYIFPASLVGRVESIQADVASPNSGWVSQLFVKRFQRVVAGDPIAEVSVTLPAVLTNSLGVILAEIEYLRSGMGPVLDSQRNAISYDQLHLNWMRQRVELATCRVNLQFACSDLQRQEMLFKNKLISDSEFDAAKAKRDSLQAEVTEQEQLISKLGDTLQRLNQAGLSSQDPTNQLRAAIAVQEEKLKLTEAELCPRLLRAPISGLVSFVRRWSGETVVPGDVVVTISTEQTERIVAYLRQPFYISPKTNMVVQVRTRGYRRASGLGHILAIGGQLQPITDVLLPPTRYDVTELGLPILVSLPDEFKVPPRHEPRVHPGEFVDLTILPKAN
jgi:multidrug resistance efflux pump